MAQFENESMSMKYSLTLDDAKKTVSVSKISPTATANTLSTVAGSFKPLFVAAPTAVKRSSVDLIEE